MTEPASVHESDTLPGETVDTVVIGGTAGLDGALALARSRRSVVVIDSGTPRDAPAADTDAALAAARGDTVTA